MSTTYPIPSDARAERRTIVDVEDDGQPVLEALNDAGSRAILAATGEEAMTASELSEACDLPLSTTYRKLELLTEAGLVSEGIRLRRSGKHTSEYVRDVEDVHLAVREDGSVEMTLRGREVPRPAPGGSW